MGILATENISKNFGGLQAISDVDLYINEGEILGLIGPNGSGKTTFLNLVSGLLRPTAGKVIFQGEDITGHPSHVLTGKGIGRTFQQNVLFKTSTVWENVLVAHEINYRGSPWGSFFNLSRSRLEEQEAQRSTLNILEEMKLLVWKDKICNDLPHGIQRIVGIAVATAVKPKLMLLDEPFAGLDASEIEVLTQIILNLKKRNITLLIVEHKISQVENFLERLTVMHEGKIIADGGCAECLRDPEVRRSYWQIDASADGTDQARTYGVQDDE
jgi:branched-chain amino acid transport system ATP-binding protein